MSGEKIHASTLPEAKEELRSIYKEKSYKFELISKEDYESFEQDEREDSDNHLNEEKLGKEAKIINLAYYKYLPEREIVYRITLKHENGDTEEDYFKLIPDKQ
ncbi:hypothetical protein GF354_01220 [Candidatus Peregrinibacteria bacterium]|nr:hypothetical protein [Candidatus Peregrinibacteria bacterium]